MTTSPFHPCRILWVDAQPSELHQAKRFLEAQQLVVRLVDNFEAALVEVEFWSPHLLLLDYLVPKETMAYETFVHVHLPSADPYRRIGPLANNPWQYEVAPILLVAGEPLASTPGLKIPHMHRAADFVSKPFDPSYLASRVHKLLPKSSPGIMIDPDQGCVEMEGNRHAVSEQRMELLVTLARHHPRPFTAVRLAQQMKEDLDVFISETAVRTAIHELRKQLAVNDPQAVVSSTRRGYVLTSTPKLVPTETPRSVRKDSRGLVPGSRP